MLKGIEINENTLLQNPGLGKSLEIIYEDEAIAIINKPFEFLSVPGKNIKDSVAERMKTLYPEATGPLVVHRLDMSTSGLMLIAKTLAVHKVLQRQFIKRKIEKEYEALLDGELTTKNGNINLPLRLDIDDRPRQLVCFEHGKLAQTEWELLEIKNGNSKVRFKPLTGRTHQLRVHAAHPLGLNMPIIGDDLYGKKEKRLYLHAAKLSFYHPINRQWLTFELKADF
jgi:tRNA pseudouridine32 synthase/23S rRNA pseudouridine746 synthase